MGVVREDFIFVIPTRVAAAKLRFAVIYSLRR